MNLVRRHDHLVNFPTAKDALAELCEPFTAGADFVPDCAEVQPALMPPEERRLLAHREHMTVVLHDHHGQAVAVHVQQAFHDGDHYIRKILLTPGATDTVVEAGIVRLHFHFMDDAVRDEILSQKTPLGQVLINHDVLRRIEPLWFVRFPPGSNVLKLFGLSPDRPTFGRLGMIYCDGEPAIELLEIVLNA